MSCEKDYKSACSSVQHSLSLIHSLLLVSSVLLSLTQPALPRTLNSSHYVAARPDRVKNGNTEING